jgi:hypothetical protein
MEGRSPCFVSSLRTANRESISLKREATEAKRSSTELIQTLTIVLFLLLIISGLLHFVRNDVLLRRCVRFVRHCEEHSGEATEAKRSSTELIQYSL